MRSLRFPGWLLAMALLAAACSTAPSPPRESTELPAEPQPTSQPTPGVGRDVPPASNPVEQADSPGTRIAVQSADATLFTVAPDGSDPLPLSPDDGARHTQPTWSPDSSLLAWATQEADGTALIRADRFDQSASLGIVTSGPPELLSWSPTSTDVAFVSESPRGRQLSTISIGETLGNEHLVDSGEPLWFTWSPDADEILVHADNFRLDRVALDGTTITIESDPGRFQTPVWSTDDRALVFADRDGQTDTLISTGDLGQGRLPLGTYEGYLRVVPNPDLNRMAIAVTKRPPAQASIITASLQLDEEPVTPIPQDQLFVVSVYGGSPQPIDRVPVSSMYWSTSGDTLAYLVQVTAGEDPWYEWRFVSQLATTSSPLFRPTDEFMAQYAPFFDQLAADVSFFSPDDEQFVFTGELLSGESGVWVLDVAAPRVPTNIADGVVAVWSPGPAGGNAQVIV